MASGGCAVPLFWRIFLLNAIVLVVAALLLLGPVTVSTPVLVTEAAVLVAGLSAMLIANAVVLRVSLAPLQRLTRAMSTIDLLRPGRRLEAGGRPEIAKLITTFNAMLDRLGAERAASAAHALSAQEAERHRIAQELHDEVGQTLTAVLLELKHVADHAAPPVRGELREAQETTRASLDEIRRIARRLRPGPLEELGLASALRSLATEFTTPGLAVTCHLDPGLPPLGHEAELVVYRVAQESLTNTARHAAARHARLTLHSIPAGVRMRVGDDGRGIQGMPEGSGIRGMRERALLIGADFELTSPEGGTEVRLTIPLGDGRRGP